MKREISTSNEELPRKPCVLVVDDEEIITRLLERQLMRSECDPVVANSGQDALSLIIANPGAFDLVVADLFMPLMSGLELAKAIHSINPTLPIILSTGDDSALDNQALGRIGIVAVARKPMTTVDFATLIAAALKVWPAASIRPARVPTRQSTISIDPSLTFAGFRTNIRRPLYDISYESSLVARSLSRRSTTTERCMR